MSAATALYGGMKVLYSRFFVTLPIPESVPGLSDATIIVTGSNGGLGYESSKRLLQLGVKKLIMAVRSPEKGEKAKAELLSATGREATAVEVWNIDMASYESVKKFAEKALLELPRIDAVLANAGMMTAKYNTTEDNETSLTVNVVATFLLFFLLLPKLKESPWSGRFAIPNSALHYVAPIKEIIPGKDHAANEKSLPVFTRLNDPDKADMAQRYPVSKLLVLYGVREIAERLKTNGYGDSVIINTPNPSYCKSELTRENYDRATRIAEKLTARTTEEGSRTLVNGILSGPESNGQYLDNCHVGVPARHVYNAQGQQIQKAFYQELKLKLEAIAPGCTANL